jgi:HD-GYP domain-containing protein (c-di-GMP phosphodiesterase class II)
METMRKHPSYSQLVLEGIPGLETAARWAGAHHERPDGKGYPELLEGAEIPLESRVIAVADTYVALTSERPYRSQLNHDQALRVLMGGSGVQLDAELVNLFCSLELPATSSRTSRRSARKR